MADVRQKVIDIAFGQVGYLEKKNGSKLDDKTANAGSANYTKFARDLDALGVYNGQKQGVAWCDVFVDWCFVQAFGLETALTMTFQPKGKSNSGAGCQYSRNYYKAKGRHFTKPEIGDQIFFWNSGKSRVSHTGIVYKVDATKVYTVEGNTSGASGVVANGGGVKKKSYALNYNRIAGYGRPDWSKAASVEVEPTPAPETPAAPSASGYKVRITGNTVNVRTGPGTQHTALEQVKKGEVFNVPAASGWTPIEWGGHVYWISDKYAELIKEG